jgi:hypothetical protein
MIKKQYHRYGIAYIIMLASVSIINNIYVERGLDYQ